MTELYYSKTAIRRFVLGRQGLWPGRRWIGKAGTAQAIHAIEAVQMDPLNVVARSHDITLWSRVLDYRPENLTDLMYQDRQFFDYGGSLFVYPIHELPYWRIHMQRRLEEGRWADFARQNVALIEGVRTELRERGPLGNRDLDGFERVQSYRGRKDTALALFCLWISGELLIHHRKRFERVYYFQDEILPAELNRVASEDEALDYFARKIVAFSGLVRENPWRVSLADYLARPIDRDEAKDHITHFIAEGLFSQIRVEGSRETWYVLSSDIAILDQLSRGELPASWNPIGATTQDEVVFLAPLDIVSARGRAKTLLDFDYVWEVYKPADQRRWGYYTLPILYGDQLVGRLDPRLERKTGTLVINGFWLEDPALEQDPLFVAALAGGLARFCRFLHASKLDIRVLQLNRFSAQVKNMLDPSIEVITQAGE